MTQTHSIPTYKSKHRSNNGEDTYKKSNYEALSTQMSCNIDFHTNKGATFEALGTQLSCNSGNYIVEGSSFEAMSTQMSCTSMASAECDKEAAFESRSNQEIEAEAVLTTMDSDKDITLETIEIEAKAMATTMGTQLGCNTGVPTSIESDGSEDAATLESRKFEEVNVKKVSTKIGSENGDTAAISLTGSDKGAAFEGIEGKTVVVGIRMDSQSREILTWALINAAMAGDRVVALHVLPGRDRGIDVVTLAKEFDDMLSVYEGFCNLKQINLKLRICKGSSIRKVLVREASDLGASQLVLGVALNNRGLGTSAVSIAKYCAKKLPGNCSVLALKSGKIIFQREVAEKNLAPKGTSQELTKAIFYEEDKELYDPSPLVCQNGQNYVDSVVPSILQTNELNDCCNITRDVKDSSICDVSPSDSCSLCSSDIRLSISDQLKGEESLAMVKMGKSEIPSGNIVPVLMGWRLLKRLVVISKKANSSNKPKNRTIQWPVRISNRSSLVYPDQKSVKSDGNQNVNLDSDSCAVVQDEADMPRPSAVYNDVEWKPPEELEALRKMYSSACRLFSFEELVEATSNFSPEMLIGRGGSSNVYKGCLPDGKELAVKTLKASEETLKEFVSEIGILTELQHKNIICLGGFCVDNSYLILVYDFLSRGSLEEILHCEKENKNVLHWPERYKVAVGVAEALSYLHGGSTTEAVIHRDVKSSNILISEDLEPQLSDFGLAKRSSTSGSQLMSNDVAGTFGYLAPECFLCGKVNEKVDVYAFGVVLLELLSGRKPISTFRSGKESLVMWAKPILLHGDLKQIIDPCLGNEYDSIQAERIMLSASLCTRRLNQARPQISVILKLLEGDDDIVNWARLEVNAFKAVDCLEEEIAIPEYDIQSHLSLALLDIEDDFLNSNTVHAVGSVEDYMQWRSGRLSSCT